MGTSRRAAAAILAAALWLSTSSAGFAQSAWAPSSRDLALLVQRFRPYLKFSTGNRQESRPMTWEHYYAKSRLKKGGSTVIDVGGLAGPGTQQVLAYSNILGDRDKARDYSIEIDESRDAQYGDPWPEVEAGAGLYAHVTYLRDVTTQSPSQNLVNIEYYLFFGSNVGYVPAEDHPGDMVGVQVVYDHASDKIVRASFTQHGHTYIMMDLAGSKPASNATLHGKDDTDKTIAQAACKVEAQDHGYSAGGLPEGSFAGGEHHVFFVPDPQTQRCEHIAVYIEHGSHEPWPNQTGYFVGVADHNGDDRSFLPNVAHILTAMDDAPFLNFGGKFGDPVAIQRHKMWLGYFRDDDAKDVDVYVDRGSVKWLPTLSPTQ